MGTTQVSPDTGRLGPRADGPGGWDRIVLKWSKVVSFGASNGEARAFAGCLLTATSTIHGIPAGIEGAGNG
jgi:hypothetical protein